MSSLMDEMFNQLEILWEQLLSEQPERVTAAFERLTEAEQKVVLEHLQRMTSAAGWQPEQRIAAKAALQALAEWGLIF